MSCISTTDLEIFKRLSNAEIVDTTVDPRKSRCAADKMMRDAIDREASRKASEKAVKSPGAVENAPPRAATSVLRKAIAAEEESHVEDKASVKVTPGSSANDPHPTPVVVVKKGDAPPPATTKCSLPPVAEKAEAVKEATAKEAAAKEAVKKDVKKEDPESDEEAGASTSKTHGKPDDERLEKQGYLIELQALEGKGVKLSRRFTMKDSLSEIEFELQKQNSNMMTENTVSFMRDTLRLLISGVEIGNDRMGPFLALDGWAESLTSDMKRYDHALERLYKRYWRKNQMSPVMELGWLILGSMVTFHFKNKFFGLPSPPRVVVEQPPAAPPQHETRTPAFSTAPRQAPRVATTGNKRQTTGRPVLRSPARSLFGM